MIRSKRKKVNTRTVLAEDVYTIDGIEVKVRRKNIKNINMRIDRNGAVIVSAPTYVSEDRILAFITSRSDWMRAHVEAKEEKLDKPERTWSTGEIMRVFGRPYVLNVIPDSRYALELSEPLRGFEDVFSGNSEEQAGIATLHAPLNSTPQRRDSFIKKEYKRMLEEMIGARLPHYEDVMDLYSSGFRIRDMKSRWGSCNTLDRELCFNLQLAWMPYWCLEYVMVHELAHIAVADHSKAFWNVVGSVLPDWKIRRKALNEMTPDYRPVEKA